MKKINIYYVIGIALVNGLSSFLVSKFILGSEKKPLLGSFFVYFIFAVIFTAIFQFFFYKYREAKK